MLRPAPHPRRGVSMLLVLLSLGTATVLTTSYLSSRDNSALIGRNVADASASRWAAISGLELGVAIMQTDTDWRTADAQGRLLDDHPVGAATVDLVVRDAVTGKPPSAASKYILLTADARIGDVMQTATANALVHPVDEAADLDLSEFSIFARDRVVLDGNALVARWTSGPMGGEGQPLAIGTQGAASGTITLAGDAAAIDATVYHGPGASSTLVMNGVGPTIGQTELGGTIPMPAPPGPGAAPPGSAATGPAIVVTGGQETINGGELHVAGVTASASGEIHLEDGVTLVTTGDVTLASGATIVVSGAAAIVVAGDLSVNAGSIVLDEGATLDVWVAGAVSLHDGFIGDAHEAGPDFDTTGTAAWLDPQRINLFGDAGEAGAWNVTGNSVVKGSFYAPNDEIVIAHQSAVYGRLAADRVSMHDDAALFYDHSLDGGFGFTKPTSPVFSPDGTILNSFAGLASLERAALVEAADRTSIAITSYGVTYHDGQAFDGEFAPDGDGTDPSAPGEPTPRPARVDMDFGSFGADVLAWEGNAS